MFFNQGLQLLCHRYGDISTSGNLAAILDFWHTSTSYDIGSTTIKSDPENVGVAVGIFSLCAQNSRYAWGGILPPPVAGKRRKKPLP